MHLLKFRQIALEPCGRGVRYVHQIGGAAHGFGPIHMFELVEAAG